MTLKELVKPEEVDIRLAVGQPSGDTPIKMVCPFHKERIGSEDDKGSFAVYRKNAHCFGCGKHFTRRYSTLAFLVGEWDGRGDENSDEVRAAVKRVKQRLEEFKQGQDGLVGAKWVPPPPTEIEVQAFHKYLLKYKEDRLVDELMIERGLTLETVQRYRLGHTGTHFTIPVPDLEGGYFTIRYRADEEVVDTDDDNFRKYDGIWGRNTPVLYPLPALRGISEVEELWIVEGEFDAIASNQAGNKTLTITNGATNISKIASMVADQLPGLHVKRWVIATDQDAAGDKAAESIERVLSESGQSSIRARWSGAKDLTEYYARGGSKEILYAQGSSVCVGECINGGSSAVYG